MSTTGNLLYKCHVCHARLLPDKLNRHHWRHHLKPEVQGCLTAFWYCGKPFYDREEFLKENDQSNEYDLHTNFEVCTHGNCRETLYDLVRQTCNAGTYDSNGKPYAVEGKDMQKKSTVPSIWVHNWEEEYSKRNPIKRKRRPNSERRAAEALEREKRNAERVRRGRMSDDEEDEEDIEDIQKIPAKKSTGNSTPSQLRREEASLRRSPPPRTPSPLRRSPARSETPPAFHLWPYLRKEHEEEELARKKKEAAEKSGGVIKAEIEVIDLSDDEPEPRPEDDDWIRSLCHPEDLTVNGGDGFTYHMSLDGKRSLFQEMIGTGYHWSKHDELESARIEDHKRMLKEKRAEAARRQGGRRNEMPGPSNRY